MRSASGVSICTFVPVSKQVIICIFVLVKLLGGVKSTSKASGRLRLPRRRRNAAFRVERTSKAGVLKSTSKASGRLRTFVLVSKQVSICTFVLVKLLGVCAFLLRRLAQRLSSFASRALPFLVPVTLRAPRTSNVLLY